MGKKDMTPDKIWSKKSWPRVKFGQRNSWPWATFGQKMSWPWATFGQKKPWPRVRSAWPRILITFGHSLMKPGGFICRNTSNVSPKDTKRHSILIETENPDNLRNKGKCKKRGLLETKVKARKPHFFISKSGAFLSPLGSTQNLPEHAPGPRNF